jgi:AcrR family transcriptional regulator
MELYSERGFDATTVAQIAERAGLTERTFFRHFADKPDVLFDGAAALQEYLVGRVAAAPPSLSALDTVVTALAETAAGVFEDRREFARRRQAIVAANAELAQREVVKLALLGSAAAGALRERGFEDPAASLAAEAGIAIFKIAFERWTRDDGARSLSRLITATADDLARLAADRGRDPGLAAVGGHVDLAETGVGRHRDS